MIVSHKHKFIFIHCAKVAGSSMKVALAPHMGPRDLVIGSLDEIIKAGQDVPPGLRPILKRPVPRITALGAWILYKSWPLAQNVAVKRTFRGQLGKQPTHPSAAQAAAFLGKDWHAYRKVCFTRNPYERIASDYNWRSRRGRMSLTFEEFITALQQPQHNQGKVPDPYRALNWDMISMNGQVVVDWVGRYERLEDDFADMVQMLGLPPTSLGWEKRTPTNNRMAYGRLYTPALRKRVEKLFETELAAFGYEYPYE